MRDLKAEVLRELAPYTQQLASVEQGQNILLKVGATYSLMKYEEYDVSVEQHSVHRLNRHTSIVTSNWLLANTNEKREELTARERREWKRHKLNVYGTHRLDFSLDEEFGIFLPSSADCDMFLTFARETIDGEIVPREDEIEIIVGDDLIAARLRNIVRPQYFEDVVAPLLEGKCTRFNVPKWSKRWFCRVNKFTLLDRFEKATRSLNHGAFVYVGCKEEVYLLGLARGDDGLLYMQGTYSTSTKPMFYFSNNYLGFISKYDAEKPIFRGKGMCNAATHRTYDIPGFGGQLFIFPQMGRHQNCKNVVFTGEPEVITGNIDRALAHFVTTDFAEFRDVLERYAEQINVVHPSSEEPNGRFYY